MYIKIAWNKRIHKTHILEFCFFVDWIPRMEELHTIYTQGSFWEKQKGQVNFTSPLNNKIIHCIPTKNRLNIFCYIFLQNFHLKVQEKMYLSTKESGSEGKIQNLCGTHRVLKYLTSAVILWSRKMWRTGEFLLRIRKRDCALFTPTIRRSSAWGSGGPPGQWPST